jgi:hypothetical protein
MDRKVKIMVKYKCENCSIRTKYDVNPKSLIGRFWHWHINFCPGWKKYFSSLNDEQKQILRDKYNLKK